MSVFGFGLANIRTVGDLKKEVEEFRPDSKFWFGLNDRDGPGLYTRVPYDGAEWPPLPKHRIGDLRDWLNRYTDGRPCEIVRRESGEIVVRVYAGPCWMPKRGREEEQTS